MFSDELEKYSWEDITACIASKRNRDVEIALGKEHLQLDDFMALVSPAAAPYIEHMAALSRLYTQERFGKTIQMYVPLYITNSCTNHCVYCGFNHNNPIARIILTEKEIENECRAIREFAYRNRRKSTRCRSRLFGTSSTNRTSLLLEPIDRSHAPQKRRLLSLDPIGSQRRGMLSRNLS